MGVFPCYSAEGAGEFGLARSLTAGSLACQLLGVLRQRGHIVGVNPSLPLHAACGKLAGLAFGLALGCCLWL